MLKLLKFIIVVIIIASCNKKYETPRLIKPVVNTNTTTVINQKFECKFYCKSGKYRRNYYYVDSLSQKPSLLLKTKTDTSFSINSDISYNFIKGSPYQYAHTASIINLSTIGNDSVRIDFYVDGVLCQSKSGLDGASIVCMY